MLLTHSVPASCSAQPLFKNWCRYASPADWQIIKTLNFQNDMQNPEI
jgi:hypothetical protein